MEEIFYSNTNYDITSLEVAASCPSNIALIKYWGKYPNQIPANPSISYTLSACRSDTTIKFDAGKEFSVKTFLGGEQRSDFSKKIENYFRSLSLYLPWIDKGSYLIHTDNTFPHSSGIASSASGFGALSKCLMAMDQSFGEQISAEACLRKASFLARLGSGSACRSLYDGLVVWGETPHVKRSSDLYGVEYDINKVHPIFRSFNDWVLLIHEGEKSVSSTVGHGLMKSNPYAKTRFEEARNNFVPLTRILREGAMKDFIALVEHEALTLHAMMMVSAPAFILMKTQTLEAINRVWNFREQTGLPLFFTLDAGANLHLLFPHGPEEASIIEFIENGLLELAQNRHVVKDKMIF